MPGIRSLWTFAAGLSLAATASPAFAQPPAEARLQELVRAAAVRAAQGQTTAPAQAPAAPTPGLPASAVDTRPVVRLSLDDAVKLALERNLDIAVQRLNPAINDIQLASLRAIYKPSLTSQLATQSQVNPATNTIAGGAAGAPIDTGLSTYNGGLAQSIPWGGGSLNITLNNNKQTTTAAISQFNPVYNTNWGLQYTQPLLRGFRTDSTRQQILVTKLNRDISDVQLRASITNTLSNVRSAYWDYVFAVESVDVARQALNLANQLVRDNQTRVQVGTMAPIDVVQAQSQAATAQQNLVAAIAQQRTAEIALKRLIVSGTDDPNWSAHLEPIDRPEFRPEPIDVEAAIRRALSERTDREIAKKTVEENDATLKLLRDQTLPQADLVANYGWVGIGGTQLIRSGTGIAGQGATILNTIPGGYSDSLRSLFGGDYPRWTLTLNVSYPLGLSAQEAAVARARVQLSQVQQQLKQVDLQIATEVTNAAVNVQSAIEAVQAAQAAREYAERQLEAENSKFEVGMSTNYFVVQAQNQLAAARNSELGAIRNYRKALVEFERVQSTTLQNLNVTLVSGAAAAPAGR